MNAMQDIPLPPGDYGIVELFGHTTLVGRISEVERFGSKMLALEPIFRGVLLPAIFHGGAAIYRLTPCSAAIAFLKAPKEEWQLPTPVRVILPPELLPAPQARAEGDGTVAIDIETHEIEEDEAF
jgi:hypothetical protein